MTLFQGASIFPWITTTARVFRLHRSSKLSAHPIPRLLQRSIRVIGSLLLLSYLTSAFDTWLHVSSITGFIQSETSYSSKGLMLGKTINEARCAYYAAQDPTGTDPFSPLCGLFLPSTISYYDLSASATEATHTLGNSSTSNFVHLTDDQHAILVPASIPARIAYNASTIGVNSQCRRWVMSAPVRPRLRTSSIA